MGQGIIILGDKTSRGGKVIGATSQSKTGTHGNIGMARQGDMVSCPRCKGIFPIAEGDASLIVDGAPVAYDGCKTACGATLIASQGATQTTPRGGGGSASGSSDGDSDTPASFGTIGAGLLAGFATEPLDEATQSYRGRFQVINESTGQPMAGLDMRVRSTGGQYLTGATDADGYTEWVQADKGEFLAFDLTDKPQT